MLQGDQRSRLTPSRRRPPRCLQRWRTQTRSWRLLLLLRWGMSPCGAPSGNTLSVLLMAWCGVQLHLQGRSAACEVSSVQNGTAQRACMIFWSIAALSGDRCRCQKAMYQSCQTQRLVMRAVLTSPRRQERRQQMASCTWSRVTQRPQQQAATEK